MKRTVILLVVLFSMALAGQAFAIQLSPTDDAYVLSQESDNYWQWRNFQYRSNCGIGFYEDILKVRFVELCQH